MSTQEAAVGSISHILKTAFKDVYRETEKRDQVAALKSKLKELELPLTTPVEAESKGEQTITEEEPPVQDKAEKSGDKKKDAKGAAPPKKGAPAKKDPTPVPSEISTPAEERERRNKKAEIEQSLDSILRPFDAMHFDDQQKSILEEKVKTIEHDLIKRGEDAKELGVYLKERRKLAKELEDIEEEDLKRQGVMLGQHIPSLPTKLDINRYDMGRYGGIAQNLVVANELVTQNKVNTLRRTGNMPISDDAEDRKVERKKRKATMVEEIPPYQQMTRSMTVREDRMKTRYAVTFKKREIERTEMIASGKIKPVREVFEKKEVMPAAERLENEAVLATMNHKLNYLRNPRNNPTSIANLLVKPRKDMIMEELPEGLDSASTLHSPSNDSAHKSKSAASQSHGHGHGSFVKNKPLVIKKQPLFVVEPLSIEFTDYEIGRTYTHPVAFRNISSVFRSVRVLPPTTPIFALEPMVYPPSCKDGYVAAGMAITSQVRFFPDSLGDYDDYLTVETEGGAFQVPILARREPPQLNIPSTLDVGFCLVGDAMRVVINCVNSGGHGKFRLLRPEYYPEVPADIDWSVETCMRLAPFTIYPLDFTLRKGEAIDITIEYVPLDIGNHSTHFYMLCDNCQVREFTVVARSREIDVSIVEVNGRHFESREPNYKRDLFFDAQYVGTEQTQKVVVANDTGIPIEYEWVWVPTRTDETQLIQAARTKVADLELRRMHTAGTAVSNDDQDGLSAAESDGVPMSSRSNKSLPLGTACSTPDLGPIIELAAAVERQLSPPSSPPRGVSPFETLEGTLAPANAVTEKEFTVSPARGVLPAEGIEHFTVTYIPENLATSSYRAVLVLKGVPAASFPDMNQYNYLENLANNGHGYFTRLRSWLEEIGCDMPGQPPASSFEAVPSKKIVSLGSILQMALSHASEEVSDVQIARVQTWINSIITHVFAWRKGDIDQPSVDDENPLEPETEENLLAQIYGSAQIDVFDWKTDGNDDNESVAIPVPPISLDPPDDDSSTVTGAGDNSSIDSATKITNAPVEVVQRAMAEMWVDIPNALKLLGGEICEYLNELVKHEAVDYLRKYAITSVGCLSFVASGEGRPQPLILDPAQVTIGGIMSVGKMYHGCVSLCNPTHAMAEVEFDVHKFIVRSLRSGKLVSSRELGAFLLSTNTPRVLLMPESEVSVDFSLEIHMLGEFAITVPIRASNMFTSIDHLTVVARVTGPRIRFNIPEIDLGLLGVGDAVKKELTFVNESDVPAKFLLKPNVEVDLESLSANLASALTGGRSTSARSQQHGSAPSTQRSDADDAQSTTSSFAVPDAPSCTVTVEPLNGLIAPQGSYTVTVTCTSGKLPQRVRGSIDCKVFDESGTIECPTRSLSFRGEVQSPKTIMYPMNIDIGKVYVGMPVYFYVHVENICNIPTKYKLERPGGASSLYTLTFDNPKGPLDAKQLVRIKGEFTASAPGPIDDVIANKIFGLLKPLGFAVKASAKGMLCEFTELPKGQRPPKPLAKPTDFQYPLKEDPPKPAPIPVLNFGGDTQLYERKKVRIVIRNLSAIPTEFKLEFAKFFVQHPPKKFAPKKEDSAKEMKNGAESSATSVAKTKGISESKTAEHAAADEEEYMLVDDDDDGFELDDSIVDVGRKDLIIAPHEDGTEKFHSIEGKKYMAVNLMRKEDLNFLQSGLGASYRVEPDTGVIPPWGVQVLTIRACNDMPGIYDDDMICTMTEVPSKAQKTFKIPLKMAVQGCPLVIEKVSLGMSKVTTPGHDFGRPLLLMGTGCVNNEPLVRDFRVKNNGSKPAKLKWRLQGYFPDVKRAGKMKFRINVNDSGKPSVALDFWEDMLHDVGFMIQPQAAVIQPYSTVRFTTKLSRTDTIGTQTAVATGFIGYYDKSIGQASVSSVSQTTGGGSVSAVVENESFEDSTDEVLDENFTLRMLVKGDFCFPSIRMEKHVLEAPDQGTPAPNGCVIALKTQAPSLFAKGARPSDVCIRPVTLTNPLDASLIFSVSTEGPFTIKAPADDATGEKNSKPQNPETKGPAMSSSQSLSSRTNKTAAASSSSIGRTYYLLPQGVAPFAVAFVPKRDIRETFKQTVSVTEAAKPNEQEGRLIVSFSTGQSLYIPLRATIATPFLAASAPTMFFGCCHVTFNTEGTLLLSNPTDVPARWTVMHMAGTGTVKKISAIRVKGYNERGPEVDDPTVFEISPSSGLVEGPTVSTAAATSVPPKDVNRLPPSKTVVRQHVIETSWNGKTLNITDTLRQRYERSDTVRDDQNAASAESDAKFPMPLRIKFMPKKNVRYSSRFRFVCEFGNTFDVILQGEGTYEEHEHKPLTPFPR